MAPAKDPKSLLWEHQLKRQHKLLSERLDQIDHAAAESQAAMDKRMLEHRQSTEATVKNLEAKLSCVGEQIRSIQEDIAAANNEHQRNQQEFKERLGGLTKQVETLQTSHTTSEQGLQQVALSEKRCALMVSELQQTVAKQGSEYEAFKERLEGTNSLLLGKVQDLELYGSGLPLSKNNEAAIPGVVTNAKKATEGMAISSHQPHQPMPLSDSDLPSSISNKNTDVPVRKSGVSANAFQPPQQVLHNPQRFFPHQAPSASSSKPLQNGEVSRSSAAVNAVKSLQEAKNATPIPNNKSTLPKPTVKCVRDKVASSKGRPTTRAPGVGRKRDFNGIVKLRAPTVIVPESPVQGRVISPLRDQDSRFGQRTPTQLFQKLQAVQETSQQPRQALSIVKNTDVRLNVPEKENLPPTGAKAVGDPTENEYTRVHIDPRDPTRIKRRRQIPTRLNN